MIGPDSERALLLNGLLAAIRLSDEPMVVTDPHQPDNPLIATNVAFQALTLYPESELVGRNCRMLQGPQTDRFAAKLLNTCVRRGEGCVQFLINYRRDGSEFFNLLFMTPVLGHDGTLHFFFASQHNLDSSDTVLPDGFPIGPAALSPGQQTEFRLLLLDIAHEVGTAKIADSMPGRVRALEAAISAARDLVKLSMQLKSRSPNP